MQKLKKKKSPMLLELQFKAVQNFKSSLLVYLAISSPNILLLIYSVHQITDPIPLSKLTASLPLMIIFSIAASTYLAFLLFSLLVFGKGVLFNIWGHLLLFFEAISGLFIEMSFKCSAATASDNLDLKWCQSDPKLQLLIVLSSVIILFSMLSLRIFFYYPFHNQSNLLSMSSYHFSPILLFYKIYISFLGNFSQFSFPSSSITSADKLIRSTFVFASILLFLLGYNKHHKHSSAKVFWNMTYTVLAWTAALNYILPVLPWVVRKDLFGYIWAYSAPFLVLLTYLMQEQRKWEEFFIQHEIFQQDQLFELVNAMVQHIDKIKKSEPQENTNYYKKLCERIGKHQKECKEKGCFFKHANIKEEQLDQRSEMKRMSKNLQICIQAAEQLLIKFQNREPDNTEVVIFTANFYFEAMKIKQRALVLYNDRMNKDIDSTQQYALHYLNRRIQIQNIIHQQPSQQATQNNLSQFQHSIQMSASMLSQFWYLLSDPKCHIQKLFDLANVIFPLKMDIDLMWQKIQPIKNIPAYNLYAKYLIEMFNDRATGFKILDQAKKIDQQIRNRKEIRVGLQDNNSIAEQNGVIFLELDESKSGTMYQTNMAAEKMFGYNKGEFTNKKVNDIMPRTYGAIHDQILENYQITNIPKMMNKDRSIWGKSKSGYLFPFTILIKPVTNFYSEKTQIYASMHRQHWLKQVAAFVIGPDLTITDVSSSILGIYPNLTTKAITKRKIPITQVIPNFLQLQKQVLQSSRTTTIEVARDSNDKQIIVFTINIEPITVNVAGLIGYLVKLTRNSSYDVYDSQVQNKDPMPFVMAFTISEESSSKQLLPTIIGSRKMNEEFYRRTSHQMKKLMNKKVTQEEEKRMDLKDYGEGIKQKRLVGNHMRDLHSEDGCTEEFQQDQQFDMEDQLDNTAGEIRPAQLSALLSKKNGDKHIFWMKIVTLFILLVSSVVIGIQYMLITRFKAQIQQAMTSVKTLKELTSQIIYMRQFVLKNTLYAPTQQDIIAFKQQITELDQLAKSVQIQSNTTLIYSDNSSQNLLLNFAINKLISECNSLNAITTRLDPNEDQVFFVSINTMNGMIESLKNEVNYVKVKVNRMIQGENSQNLWFLCSILPMVLLFIFVNNFLLQKVLNKKAGILEIFFEMPRKTCKNLQKECQRFTQKLANSDQNNIEVQSDIEQQAQQSSDSSKQSKRKKRSIQGQDRTKFNFLIATLVFLFIMSLFPIISISYFSTHQKAILDLSTLISQIAEYEPGISRTLCSINSLVTNDSLPILGSNGTRQDSMKKILDSFESLHLTDHSYNTHFFLVKNTLDKTFTQNYDSIMFKSICTQNGPCLPGMNVGLNLLYSTTIQYLEDKYTQYVASAPTPHFTSLSTIQTQTSTQKVLKTNFRLLSKLLLEATERMLTFRDTIMFSMLLVLIAINFLTYFFGWVKFFNLLQAKMMSTQYILTFIPISEINRNGKIAKYIKKKMLEKRKE